MTENQQPPHRPGEWPTDRVDLDGITRAEQEAERAHGDRYAAVQRERARHELVLDSIRYDLQQHPSPATVRAAARAWCTRITAAAEDIVRTMR